MLLGTDAEGPAGVGRIEQPQVLEWPAEAAKRIKSRLEQVRQREPTIEYRFSMADSWSWRLFTALLRRYGLKPYRYRRQRYTMVKVRVPKSFVDQTL